MLRALTLFAVLFLYWFIFSGYTESFFIISGLISCALAVLIAHRMNVVGEEGHPLHLTPRAIVYWLWLGKEIIMSGIGVCGHVWQRKLKITPVLGYVPTKIQTDEGLTILANSITLTPGTVCINVADNRLEVHALDSNAFKEIEQGEMERRVRRVTGEL